MLRSDLSDYSNAHIVVKAIITVTGTNNDNRINKKLVLRIMLHFNQAYQKPITRV